MPTRTRPYEFLLPIALLIFAGFWFYAVSRPAPPSPPPPQNGVQMELPPSAMDGVPTALYERGTQQSPLIVEFADTPAARQHAADEAAWRRQEAADSQRIMLVCDLLGIIAFIQFVALIMLTWWMTRWVQNRRP